jgi:ribosomal protein S8
MYANRVIQGYITDGKPNEIKSTFNSRYFRGVPYFSHFRVISTPSKIHSISAKGIRVINKSIGNSVLLIETDKGIISHTEALSYNIGGKLLGIVS